MIHHIFTIYHICLADTLSQEHASLHSAVWWLVWSPSGFNSWMGKGFLCGFMFSFCSPVHLGFVWPVSFPPQLSKTCLV